MQPSPFKAALVAVILASMPGAAPAQTAPAAAPSATPEFTIERRDALRRVWRTDAAIRDHVGPGDAERLDAQSSFYAEDYTAGQSLAPPPPAPDVAVADVPEPAR